MILLKICGMALAAVVLISLLRVYRPEFVPEAVICASVLMLMYILGSFRESLSQLEDLYQKLSCGSTCFPVILKALGIAYVTDFTSAVCMDAGEKAVAGKVELAGKIAVFFAALPVFQSLLELFESLL